MKAWLLLLYNVGNTTQDRRRNRIYNRTIIRKEKHMKTLTTDFLKKLSETNSIRPAEYDLMREIFPIMEERPRFANVMRFCRCVLCSLDRSTFSDKYTNHYFIHAYSANDALLAAVAICNTIYEKYDYVIGDRLVDISSGGVVFPLAAFAGNGMCASVMVSPEQITPDGFSDDCDNEDKREDNASLFWYERSTPDSLTAYDADGVQVCFVLYADELIEKYKKEAGDSIFGSGINILPPRQAAAELHYTYIDIPKESSDELRVFITDYFNKKGFGTSRVKKLVAALSERGCIKSEYHAASVCRCIMNRHLYRYAECGELDAEDFSDYLAVKSKAVRADKKDMKLIGLDKELKRICGAVNMLEFDRERYRRGLSYELSGCNMVFAGQPGTAKTSAAREFASMLMDRGIITDKANFRECRKSDIVGQFVGQTAKKVDDLFSELDSIGGGVIFFDEIYTLSENDSTCYDKEAINCITQNMENYRSSVFCIFAGYENKMKYFLESNPGLSSRVTANIIFAPYDNELLCRIFKNMVKSSNFVIREDCDSILNSFFGRLRELRGSNFGNGREARNLFENTKRIMADRVLAGRSISKASLMNITPDDISMAAKEILGSDIGGRKPVRTIGF